MANRGFYVRIVLGRGFDMKKLTIVLFIILIASLVYSQGGMIIGSGTVVDTTAPTLSSATIGTDGTTWTFIFSEIVSIGAGGNGGWAVSTSTQGAVTLTYSSGVGSDALVYTGNKTVLDGETVISGLDYTQPENGIEDGAGNDFATLTSYSVANDSTQTGIQRSDNFNRDNANPIGGNWTTLTGFDAIKLDENMAGYVTGSPAGVRWNADTFTATQYSEVKPAAGWGAQGPAVRMQSAAETAYLLQCTSATNIDVIRLVAGTFTTIASRTVSSMTLGTTVVKLTVSGTGATVTLAVYVDGAKQGADISDTDATRITGAGSVGFYTESGYLDDWAGGDL